MAIATINPATGEVIETFSRSARIRSKRSCSSRCRRFAPSARLRSRSAPAHAESRRRFWKATRSASAALMTLEMGKPLQSRRGRGGQVRHGLPLLRRKRRERFLADEVVDTNAKKKLRAVSADRSDPGGDAVELSFLAGVPLRRAGADGGQCRAAEACLERSAVRARRSKRFARERDSRRASSRRC